MLTQWNRNNCKCFIYALEIFQISKCDNHIWKHSKAIEIYIICCSKYSKLCRILHHAVHMISIPFFFELSDLLHSKTSYVWSNFSGDASFCVKLNWWWMCSARQKNINESNNWLGNTIWCGLDRSCMTSNQTIQCHLEFDLSNERFIIEDHNGDWEIVSAFACSPKQQKITRKDFDLYVA